MQVLKRNPIRVGRFFIIKQFSGKRLCAGETFGRQNMFLMAASLLQNFTFSPCGSPPDLNDQIPGANVSLPDYRMKITAR